MLLRVLQQHRGSISIKQLSDATGFKTDDVLSTLKAFDLVKYWKGQHMISISPRVLQEHLTNRSQCNAPQVDLSGFSPTWLPLALRPPKTPH